ncbi:MAG: NADPH-dependent F420 reductase [Candidatus Nanopelagicales bacterium]
MPSPLSEAAARPDPWQLPDVSDVIVGVVGGTGEQGRGLALRWAVAGLSVIIGSRDPARAQEAADAISAATGTVVGGLGNAACAAAADVVLIAVPYEHHRQTLVDLADELAGRIVIDCVNPLGFDAKGAYALAVPDGSAAQEAALVLPEARVVAAFHHVSAKVLGDPEAAVVPCDVLVLGDDRGATDVVQALACLVPGMRGVYAGRLRNAGQIEAMTANLISINRRYRAHSSLAVTGL